MSMEFKDDALQPLEGSGGWYGKVGPASLRTQKGLGVAMLATHLGNDKVPAFTIVQTKGEMVKQLQGLLVGTNVKAAHLPWPKWQAGASWGGKEEVFFNIFCRPMPTVPKHGFVDSRMVHNLWQLHAVWDEMVKVEPKGELMLMAPIKAALNFIITPGGITIGPGHDGATAGKHCYSLPMLPKLNARWQSICQGARVGGTEWPFFEAVLTKEGRLWLTQLRAGPQIMQTAPDLIPEDVTVVKVIETVGDLLEWEALMAKEWAEGTVIWHPGGSLWSHYAVHAAIHKLPIMISRKPVVGELLAKNSSQQPEYDLRAMRAGVVAGTTVPISRAGMARNGRTRAVQTVLFAMHNGPVLRGSHAFWVGAGAALMHRLGVAASLGEWRHAKGGGVFKGLSRDQVYDEAFPRPFFARKLLPQATDSFVEESWAGGFGGKKWANCARSVVRLDRALIGVMGGGEQPAAIELLDALNNAVNQAHNNGWWMNKFIDQSAFDQAAAGDFVTVFEALPFMAALMGAALTEDVLDLNARRWGLARQIAVAANPKLSVSVTSRKIVQAQVRPMFSVPSPTDVLMKGSFSIEDLSKLSTGLHLQYRFEGQVEHERLDVEEPLTPEQMKALRTAWKQGTVNSMSGNAMQYLAVLPYVDETGEDSDGVAWKRWAFVIGDTTLAVVTLSDEEE